MRTAQIGPDLRLVQNIAVSLRVCCAYSVECCVRFFVVFTHIMSFVLKLAPYNSTFLTLCALCDYQLTTFVCVQILCVT